MAIVFNEAALRRLLQDPAGLVGRDLKQRAENVARLAKQNASGEIIGIRSGDLIAGIRAEVSVDAKGLRATVGSTARHRGVAYPAVVTRKGGTPGGWLLKALRDGLEP